MRRGAGHPKMAALVAALLRHFGGGGDGPEGGGEGGVGGEGADGDGGAAEPEMGRAIVFTNLRESVAAIMETLAPHAPLIKPRYPAASLDPPRNPALSVVLTLKLTLGS